MTFLATTEGVLALIGLFTIVRWAVRIGRAVQRAIHIAKPTH